MGKSKRKSKAAFSYFGSKYRLALSILKYLPPHNAWVDALCGSAALTLAKSPAPIEIINDINGEIINFFEQLRKHPEKIYSMLDFTPYAREELKKARENGGRISQIERARRFIVSSMMSINGMFGDHRGGFSYSNSYARSGMEARVSRWNNMPLRLQFVVERLKNVRIENKDARTLVKAFVKRPATLMYLDPPYLAKRSKGYDFDQTNEKFHEELLDLACTAKCMILISGYDNPLYKKYLKSKFGWKTVKISTHTQGSNGKRMERIEYLWQNEYCVKAHNLKRVPINLTKNEKKLGKINPVRGK